jgi:DNA-binding MurR/RpiR family transcriptional regulator
MIEHIVVPAQQAGLTSNTSFPLTRKQQALVAFIEHNPKFASFATTAALADRVGVHPATVVRLAQLLGYPGFPEFQESIQHRYLASLDAVALMHDRAPERHGDVSLASIDQDMRNLSTTRSLLDPDELRNVARAILAARSILSVGFGSHAGIAQIFCHLLRFMGLPAELENRGGVTLATRLTSIGPGDVVIGTSAWWVVRESREALAVAKELGATTIAIVDNRMSAMAELADYVLLSKTESVSYFQSMLGPLAVLNALAAEIASIGEDQVRDSMEMSSRMFERLGAVWHDVGEITNALENAPR